jgi:predicted small secreted protein
LLKKTDMRKTTTYVTLLTLLCIALTGCNQFKTSRTTSGFNKGSVIRGEQARHKVAVKAGQTLDVNITSDEDNAVFQIYLPGETGTLPGAGEMDEAKNFSGKAPSAGDYIIVVSPTRGNATYKLTYTLK